MLTPASQEWLHTTVLKLKPKQLFTFPLLKSNHNKNLLTLCTRKNCLCESFFSFVFSRQTFEVSKNSVSTFNVISKSSSYKDGSVLPCPLQKNLMHVVPKSSLMRLIAMNHSSESLTLIKALPIILQPHFFPTETKKETPSQTIKKPKLICSCNSTKTIFFFPLR